MNAESVKARFPLEPAAEAVYSQCAGGKVYGWINRIHQNTGNNHHQMPNCIIPSSAFNRP